MAFKTTTAGQSSDICHGPWHPIVSANYEISIDQRRVTRTCAGLLLTEGVALARTFQRINILLAQLVQPRLGRLCRSIMLNQFHEIIRVEENHITVYHPSLNDIDVLISSIMSSF